MASWPFLFFALWPVVAHRGSGHQTSNEKEYIISYILKVDTKEDKKVKSLACQDVSKEYLLNLYTLQPRSHSLHDIGV